MKQQYELMIRGERREWSITVWAEPEWVEDWREDDLALYEVINTIPEWVVTMGLARVWCFFQDLFNFRNRWRK